MSREIKVRAWDEDAEHMFYSDKPEDDYFFEFRNGQLRGFAIRPPRPSSDPMEPPEPYCDDYPVMESTGLKDKYGVEIWEDDIVTGKNGRVGFIEYEEGAILCCNFYRITGEKEVNNVIFHKEFGSQLEVIGNRHQHPKLLEAH